MVSGQIVTIVLGVASIYLGYKISRMLEVPPIPDLLLDQWWGPGSPKPIDKSIRPFKIDFNQKKVDALKTRLKASDYFTAPLETIGFQYGFNNEYFKEVVDFWQNKYDFVAREKYLNQYSHFKTNIQGLDIHYVHVKPEKTPGVKVLPLLLLHGWPGSFIEFYRTIPLLTKSRPGTDFVFELIIPSLPGYGYSQAASKPGHGVPQMAVVMKNLMERLGHPKYIVQGGDWGSMITAAMAIMFPKNIIGYHTNMPIVNFESSTWKLFLGSFYPKMIVEEEYQHKLYPLSDMFSFLIEEMGYFHIQATKPDTVGIALRDSPVGLAGYILEKFSTWTNPEWKSLKDGGLTKKYDLSYLLDNIMIYWDSKSITTSMRMYAESFSKKNRDLKLEAIPIMVPTAIARFLNEISFITKWQMADKYMNIVQLSTFENGGHFAAFEEPEILANDIWSAAEKFIQYHSSQKKNKK